MDIEYIKEFLKVYFDDDNAYIELLYDVAKEYITDSIGEYDETSARHKLLALNIISNLYENRLYTIDKNDEKVMYTLRSMILQLQLG